MLDIQTCQAKFYDENWVVYPNVTQYQYNGSVSGIYWDVQLHPPFLTYEGCQNLCGSDAPLYYSWPEISTTISTWILPIVTLILQAPFESNALWSTIFAVFHWIGSPISSLAAVLWNIKVCGDCALIVDLSTCIDNDFEDESIDNDLEDESIDNNVKDESIDNDFKNESTDNDFKNESIDNDFKNESIDNKFENESEACKSAKTSFRDRFEAIRDSFYLLSTMNQFSVHEITQYDEDHRGASSATQGSRRSLDKRAVAERLLRVVLFSDMLKLKEGPTLPERRRKLAATCRDFRKRAVVPVFLTLMWFVYSLVTSVVQTFNTLGGNISAHSLALGLLLGWIPIFILASVVDRNPTQPDAIRKKLNKLVSAVRKALLDEDLKKEYIRKLKETHSTRRTEGDFAWVYNLKQPDEVDEDFFTRFAGQGRVRWHYGIAHDVLAGIKQDFLLQWNFDHGRYWLADDSAREKMVAGPKKIAGFLAKFRPSSVWQLIAALIIIGCSLFGALILSYKTPTEGLGCRSGGYLIYFILIVTTLIIELLCWFLTSPGSKWDGYRRNRSEGHAVTGPIAMPHGLSRKIMHFRSWCLSQWREFSRRDKIEIFILRPIEIINTVWLSYIVMSQTTGAYSTCECKCSVWGLGKANGYMDFQTQITYLQYGISAIWAGSTAMGCLPTAICFSYIVHEWCVQSHLSTVDFRAAMKGLKRTRSFRGWTSPIRDAAYEVLDLCYRLVRNLPRRRSHQDSGRNHYRQFQKKYPSIRWTAKYRPQVINNPSDVEDFVDGAGPESMSQRAPELMEGLYGFAFPQDEQQHIPPIATLQPGHNRLPLLGILTSESTRNDRSALPSNSTQLTQYSPRASLDITRVPTQTDSANLSPLDTRASNCSLDRRSFGTNETVYEDITPLITRPRPVSRTR